jgi:Na+/H+ antiporter NhaD/arsenite permease-like protein
LGGTGGDFWNLDKKEKFLFNQVHDARMYTETLIVLLIMVGTYIVLSLIGRFYKQKIPIALLLFLSCVVGLLAGGYGFPLRHLIEGEFGYLYINLVIFTGMILLQVLKHSGSLDAISWDILVGFRKRPIPLFLLLGVMLFFPGMVTGVGTAAVLSTGIFVATILMMVGVPKRETAAILAMLTTFGAAAPPVNLPALIISGGINMPYEGFGTILWVLTVPVAIFSIFYLGYGHFKIVSLEEIKKMISPPERKLFIIPYIPLIVLGVLFAAIRLFPTQVPDLATPLVFMIGAIVGLFTGKRVHFLHASKEAMRGGVFMVVALLFVVGTVVQVATLTGVKGLLVSAMLTIASTYPILMYVAMGISLPLLGGVLTHLGSSAILGVPFALSLLTKNTIVVVAAISLISVLSQLVPPSAVGGYFAQDVVQLETYLPILKRCAIPAVVTVLWAILIIILASYFGTAFVPY